MITECSMEYDTVDATMLNGPPQRVISGQSMTLNCAVIGDDVDRMQSMLSGDAQMVPGGIGGGLTMHRFNSAFVIIRAADLERLLPEYAPPVPPQRPRLRPARRSIDLGDE